MLSAMLYDAIPPLPGQAMGVNYGMNKMRFLSPVPSDARIRARFVLAAVDDSRPGEVTTTHNVTIEIEGQDKPALIAEWIGRQYLAPADPAAKD